MEGKKTFESGKIFFPSGPSPRIEATWHFSRGNMRIVGFRGIGEGPVSFKAFSAVFGEVERIALERKARKIIVETWLPPALMKRYGFKRNYMFPSTLIPSAVQKPLMKAVGYGPSSAKRWKGISMRKFVKRMKPR